MAEVVIFGAGPSGLMAAHAAETAGHEVVKLYDANPKPPDGTTAGVFYLHAPCGLNVASQMVKVAAEGERREYARRMYGDPQAKCNWPTQPYVTEAWDGMIAVNMLWWRYQDRTEHALIRMQDIRILAKSEPRRIFINTVPLNFLMETELPYALSQILTTCGKDIATAPHMIYMGIPGVEITRRSFLFGRYAMEAPMDVDWSHHEGTEWQRHVVKKVISDREADKFVAEHEQRFPNLFFTGRYGRWDKTMLTHKVYEHVLGRLSS